MKQRAEARTVVAAVLLLAGACAPASSPGTGTGGKGSGGTSAGSGGSSAGSGGATATGGAASGGTSAGSGGSSAGSGGMTASGGAPASGGNPATGGAAAGGHAGGAAGGATNAGGSGPSGGRGGGAGGGALGGAAGAGDLSIAAPLNSSAGFKMQAPCGTPASTLRSCDHNPKNNCGTGLLTFFRTDKTLGGSKGTFYDVKLRFRGILEANMYAGGTSDHDGFYTGGQTSNASGMDGGQQYNQYVLEVSSPKTTYHLNNIDQNQRDMYRMGLAGSSGVHHFGFIIDYHKTIRMEGGSTVSLYMLDNDCLFGRNCKPPADDVGHCDLQTLPDLPGIPQPFDGNFIWIDVESVTPAP